MVRRLGGSSCWLSIAALALVEMLRCRPQHWNRIRAMVRRIPAILIGLMLTPVLAGPAFAADIKVLTAGAMRAVVDALVPEFERRSGHRVSVDNATAGVLARRIGGGEAFDVAIIT